MRKKVITVKSMLVDCLVFILAEKQKHVFDAKVNLGAYRSGFFRSAHGGTLVKLRCMTTPMGKWNHSESSAFPLLYFGEAEREKKDSDAVSVCL